MAEVSAFLYGCVLGITAVVLWILYGTDALPHLKRSVGNVLACIPGMAHFAEGKAARRTRIRDADGTSASYRFSRLDGAASDQGLEGLTECTKNTQPITVAATCMMSRYGSDGTISPPIECLLSLEGNVVTVYQLLPLADSNPGSAAAASRGCVSVGTDLSDVHGDSRTFRTASGATVVERRRGKVCVLNTTVMEVRQFNVSKKSAAAAANPSQSSAGDRGARGGSVSEPSSAKTPAKPTESSGFPLSLSSGTLASGSDDATDRREESKSDSTASAKRSKGRKGNAKSAATAAGASETSAANSIFGGGGADSLFTGRVLIWRTLDGRPLFDASTPQGTSPGNGTGGSSFADPRSGSTLLPKSLFSSAGGAGAASRSPTTESVDGRSANSSADADDGDDSTVTDGAGDGASAARYQHRLPYGSSRQQRRSMLNDMASWSCVIIKFERSRESERWYTLLSGLKEAQAWHDYAKSMPNPDTINTFLSRFVFQNMRLNGLSDALISQVRKKLRELPAKKFPRDLGGDIILDDFLIGTQIPWISDVSEPRVSANGEVGFDFNLFYKGGEGGFSLFFRLALTYCGIRIPHVVFSVKLLEVETTVHVSIGPPPSKIFWIGAHKPPIIRLEVHQGCASGKGVLHRMLTALPNLSGIVTNLIKLYLFTDMVLPYMDDFPLPSVVKSPKGSFADLRVRAFDWQRAAKISGAPQREAPAASSSDRDTERKVAGRNTHQKRSGGYGSPLRLRSSSDYTAGSTSYDPARETSRDTVATDSKATFQKASPDARLASSNPRAGTGAKLSVFAPPDSDADGGRFSGASFRNTSNSVSSSVAPASPTERAAAQAARDVLAVSPRRAGRDGGGDHTRLPDAPPRDRMGSRSASISSNLISASTLDESACGDNATVTSDSEDVLSTASKRRASTAGAMRNLKDWLKVKGNDMARESVSRSKKKK
ncbi:hypothetical protein CUR178_08318 [Leishmania enriettii]|uniref:SMP-LTD domain-containing protein n=1 Tax=Leishmania enriettii TaxID=5663 RepID=A0A836KQZ8_LEIEN|nr:hypothetical protein CUR178_08318 [Leishmania enriettii]